MNPATSASTTGTSTIGSLLSELRAESTTLLRQEVALAKAELSEKAGKAATASMAIAGGGAVAYAGLIVLLIGAGQLLGLGLVAAGLSENIAAWLGPVIVGAIAGGIGLALLAKAKKELRPENFRLTETAGSLKDDKDWVQGKIEHAQHQP